MQNLQLGIIQLLTSSSPPIYPIPFLTKSKIWRFPILACYPKYLTLQLNPKPTVTGTLALIRGNRIGKPVTLPKDKDIKGIKRNWFSHHPSID